MLRRSATPTAWCWPVRFADGKEILLRRQGKGPVTTLNWDRQGYRIAFGSEAGDCGVIDITG